MHQVLARLRLGARHARRSVTANAAQPAAHRFPSFRKNKIVNADTRIFRQRVSAAASNGFC